MHEATALAAAVERLRAAGCVFAEDEVALLASVAQSDGELDAMVARRADGVPVEQIVGWAEFCGLRVAVEPGVFVPRRRTERLAKAAAARASSGSVVVDMCCGSGAVGLAVATLVPGVHLHAVDIDAAAVRCARRNLATVGGQVYEGDLFRPLSVGLLGAVDVLTVNAPYVPTDRIPLLPPEARLHEPMVALDGGADGLDVHRRVAAAVPLWLAPGGTLLAECNREQAPTLSEVYATTGGTVEIEVDDETQTAIVTLVNPS
ncbi:MAG TPA: putative protein N(5)-glutamine methyltransferase [Mycobacteriales bacterium]|nr:putative protein N(5)-glutamine methyltransferase [Mycobacteriales bacterium]